MALLRPTSLSRVQFDVEGFHSALPTSFSTMANSAPLRDPLKDSIGILGTGPAALIQAHVLLEDGFERVTLVSRDRSVGGVWAAERIYPCMEINT